MQTFFLAKISDRDIKGIDIFEQYLARLRELIVKENLQKRVKAVNQSMFDIKYPKEYFDVIWAEGSIFIIGFEKDLLDWKKYIKPNGYIAVHEMTWLKDNPPEEIREYWENVYPDIKTINKNLQIIKKC